MKSLIVTLLLGCGVCFISGCEEAASAVVELPACQPLRDDVYHDPSEEAIESYHRRRNFRRSGTLEQNHGDRSQEWAP